MKKTIMVALIAAASFFGGMSNTNALVVGWNFIRVAGCYGLQANGVDYLYIYPTTGGYFFTFDSTTISAAAQFCANGNAFYIYWTGTTWNGVLIYPGLK